MPLFRNAKDRSPRPGDVLAGKYRVEAVIGHGGMGVVVAAVHRELGQRVAVKVMFDSAGRSRDSLVRFLREAQTASMLRSEHGVRIHDVGRLKSGAAYIVMEFLAGTDLARVLASRGPLPVTEVVDYVLQGCEAIAEAHRLGIVHRDLKPSNLFLTQRTDGTPCVKVLDFGISKVEWLATSGFTPDLTATMEAMGTPVYMSPEQVRASRVADPRTDIWALGVVLYELLLGQPPFWADSLPAISAKIVSDPPIPPGTIRVDLPSGLDAVVMSCLEKDPANRPQTISDLAKALEPWASPAGQLSVRQIERIARLPLDALASQPLALPLLEAAGGKGRSFETNHAWGTTRGKLGVSARVGLLGIGTGTALGLTAILVWLVFLRGPSAATSASAASGSAVLPFMGQSDDGSPADASTSNAAPPASGASSVAAAGSSAGSAGSAPAAPAASTVPARPPPRGGRGRDPLDERY